MLTGLLRLNRYATNRNTAAAISRLRVCVTAIPAMQTSSRALRANLFHPDKQKSERYKLISIRNEEAKLTRGPQGLAPVKTNLSPNAGHAGSQKSLRRFDLIHGLSGSNRPAK